jgi:hypothetical protein
MRTAGCAQHSLFLPRLCKGITGVKKFGSSSIMLTRQRRSQEFGRWQRLADHPGMVDYSRIFADWSMASIKSKQV